MSHSTNDPYQELLKKYHASESKENHWLGFLFSLAFGLIIGAIMMGGPGL